MTDPTHASATDLAAAIAARAITAGEVVDAYLARIAARNPALNAIVTLDEVGARARAAEADAALARGESWGPLHGVPVTLKDGHSTAGMRTTAGFPPLARYVPAADGAVAARLRAAGAIILGKTNVSTLLADIQSDNPVFGRTNNPWNLERTPGGSSGGAAAALAAGLTALDVGSDFAGSVRIPAAFCGVYGLRPTEHRVPLTGHIPPVPGAVRTTRILWAAGPLARSVADLALAFRVLAGPDPGDPDVPPRGPALAAPRGLADLRVAWAPTFPGVPAAAAVRGAVEVLAAALVGEGARVEERLPDVSFEEMAKLRTMLARAADDVLVPAADAPPPTLSGYLAALDRRDALIAAWEAFFAAWDVLLCPVAMTTAFAHCPTGTPIPVDGTPAGYWRAIGHCTPFSLTGHPAVVLPAGVDAAGLPVGVQAVGPRWQDEWLLAIAGMLAEVAGPFQPPPEG